MAVDFVCSLQLFYVLPAVEPELVHLPQMPLACLGIPPGMIIDSKIGQWESIVEYFYWRSPDDLCPCCCQHSCQENTFGLQSVENQSSIHTQKHIFPEMVVVKEKEKIGLCLNFRFKHGEENTSLGRLHWERSQQMCGGRVCEHLMCVWYISMGNQQFYLRFCFMMQLLAWLPVTLILLFYCTVLY